MSATYLMLPPCDATGTTEPYGQEGTPAFRLSEEILATRGGLASVVSLVIALLAAFGDAAAGSLGECGLGSPALRCCSRACSRALSASSSPWPARSSCFPAGAWSGKPQADAFAGTWPRGHLPHPVHSGGAFGAEGHAPGGLEVDTTRLNCRALITTPLFEHKPDRCPSGHDLGPGRMLIGWSPCACTPALEADERGQGEQSSRWQAKPARGRGSGLLTWRLGYGLSQAC